MEELEVLKGYVESLKLHEKTTLTVSDLDDLHASLKEADELGLADYVARQTPEELHDLIVNTLYG